MHATQLPPKWIQPAELLIVKIKNGSVLYDKAQDISVPVQKYESESAGSRPTSKRKPVAQTLSCAGNVPRSSNHTAAAARSSHRSRSRGYYFREKPSGGNPQERRPPTAAVPLLQLVSPEMHLAMLKCKQMLDFRVNTDQRQPTLPGGR